MPYSKAQRKAHKALLVNAKAISKHERVAKEYSWPNRLSLAHVKDFRFQPKIWGAFVVFRTAPYSSFYLESTQKNAENFKNGKCVNNADKILCVKLWSH